MMDGEDDEVWSTPPDENVACKRAKTEFKLETKPNVAARTPAAVSTDPHLRGGASKADAISL